MNFEKPSLTKDVFTTASNGTESIQNRLSDERLQEIQTLTDWEISTSALPGNESRSMAAELLAARKQIAELDRLSAENATFREWIDRSGDTFTRMHAENANLRDELKSAIRLPCKVGDTAYAYLDDEPEGSYISEYSVMGVCLKEDGWYLLDRDGNLDRVGTTYALLTRAEAEAALEQKKDSK